MPVADRDEGPHKPAPLRRRVPPAGAPSPAGDDRPAPRRPAPPPGAPIRRAPAPPPPEGTPVGPGSRLDDLYRLPMPNPYRRPESMSPEQAVDFGLHQLEQAGYLTSSTEVVGGKQRKYYRATPEGARALEEAKAKLRELVKEVVLDDPPTPSIRKREPDSTDRTGGPGDA